MKITNTILIVIAGLIALSVFTPDTTVNLAGFGAPQISSASVINSSSTPGTNGAIIITNASNTGDWFRILNISGVDGNCGLASATSSVVSKQGQRLVSATSTGAGKSDWEMFNAKGPVACIGDEAGFAVSFSYTGR